MAEQTDSELASLAVAGDDSAFAELAGRYRSRVFGTASRFARDRHELEDLAQEIFVRIWKGLPGFRGDAPFEHWCMRIAVRSCYDFLRKVRRRRESEWLTDAPPEFDRPTGAEEGDPECARRDAWETVQWLLQHLPEKDRIVVVLLDLEQKSVREIAELTGYSESNVKVKAHRARKKMREIYDSLERHE
ncbi:MAG: RNA polymerase sigma factor [Verrucomicrobiae bacterium]|nr:RNA polymerase sigma factor [Verrucomicrobiae bacterium]MCP5539284.1 RNA polymerase sigma factor [Akkermansiaceae bacterium]